MWRSDRSARFSGATQRRPVPMHRERESLSRCLAGRWHFTPSLRVASSRQSCSERVATSLGELQPLLIRLAYRLTLGARLGHAGVEPDQASLAELIGRRVDSIPRAGGGPNIDFAQLGQHRAEFSGPDDPGTAGECLDRPQQVDLAPGEGRRVRGPLEVLGARAAFSAPARAAAWVRQGPQKYSAWVCPSRRESGGAQLRYISAATHSATNCSSAMVVS